MKHVIKTALAVSALAALAGCGLRGDLERPPPIFSDPPSEEAKVPVDAPVFVAEVKVDPNQTYYNSIGGEIPKPAPGTDVEEEIMGDPFTPG